MNENVLDASAMLAIIQHEKGADYMTDEIMANAVMSTVNLAEVQSKLVKNGYDPKYAWLDSTSMLQSEEPFTSDQARIAGDLMAQTANYGLSLGDRACLALAISLNAPIYTTEKLWQKLKLGIKIHVIR